jgi:ABC-type nitrate/sulfonate/bicarbonate transport system substrate-binding protein
MQGGSLMKRRWLVIWILLFTLVLFRVDHAIAQEEVKIGYLTLVMSLPTFVALEKGFF